MRNLVGRVGPVDRDHIVVVACLAVGDKVLSGAAGELLVTREQALSCRRPETHRCRYFQSQNGREALPFLARVGNASNEECSLGWHFGLYQRDGQSFLLAKDHEVCVYRWKEPMRLT